MISSIRFAYARKTRGVDSPPRRRRAYALFVRSPYSVTRARVFSKIERMSATVQSMTLLNRLMQKVSLDPNPNGCWVWEGVRTNKGYGEIGVDYKKRLAHRVSWELHYGPIPSGMVVCHKCDNPPCVNPLHLFVGTPSDNQRDMFAKGRNGRSTRPRPDDFPCVRGHAPNWRRNNRGHRFCVDCRSENEIRRRAKKRERRTWSSAAPIS